MKAIKTNTTKKTESRPKLFNERRRKSRKAPGFPSRKNVKLVDGLTKAEIVHRYSQKVKIIALRIANRLGHAVEVEDLMSMGYIGLMNAADRFKPEMGVKFETYAEYRIRGTIFDEIRKQDWVPRSARDRARAMSEVVSSLEARKDRTPTDREISKELGVKLEKYYKMRSELGNLSLLNFPDASSLSNQAHAELSEAVGRERPSNDPFSQLCRKDAREIVGQILDNLNESERVVITCYYFRGLNQSEIAQILDLTEARISQMHSKAILKLREHLKTDITSVKKLFLLLFGQESPQCIAS